MEKKKKKVWTDWTRTCEDEEQIHLDGQEFSRILVNYGHQTIQPYSDAATFDGGCCNETKTPDFPSPSIQPIYK